ncbi:MAG TPA: UTP--glucose-1-phosphate uridylyltransferase GalU [Bacillales bacterium]|nr:UTP--glucose-1-phosphate uridylyltransferase GalU [Bacillales bacterium]
MEIKKAIIPAAGLGTRLLPATKAQPKEMLPIVDKPAIQYIVEEAVAAGIEDLIVITGRGKRAIEDHFDKSYELEEELRRRNKTDNLREVRAISELGHVHYIRQGEAKGLGHATACSRSFIGNEPFAVLLGDDIVRSGTPCIKQLMDVYEETKSTVVGVQQVEEQDVEKYGIIAPGKQMSERVSEVKKLVEKPSVEEAPSRLAIMGRYILTPDIFPVLERQKPDAGGEIQLTDAINELAGRQPVYACNFEGRRYDTGNKLSLIKTTLELALERDDLKDDLTAYLKNLVDHIK